MNVVLATPEGSPAIPDPDGRAPGTRPAFTGNDCTANQWATVIENLGHHAVVRAAPGVPAAGNEWDRVDVLVALHAVKTAAAVGAFRERRPGGKVVVVLTGTDLYPELGPVATETLRLADRVVTLQEGAARRMPPEFAPKVRTIVQAVVPPAGADGAPHPDAAPSSAPEPAPGEFAVCVVGNIRAVKDPLRPALAARLLPAGSKVVVHHAGAIIEAPFESAVAREVDENPRYRWLGSLEPVATWQLIARSRLLVHPSLAEGGARVLGEAAVAGTPVLAARNDASLSLLSPEHPGLFDAGSTDALADLLHRAETDEAFYGDLDAATRNSASLFDPARERAAWRALLQELSAPAPDG